MGSLVGGFVYGLFGLMKNLTGYSFSILAILLGILVAWFLSKHGIGEGKARWIVLFSVEGIAIVWAMIASQWGISWEQRGYGFLLGPRVSLFFYVLELIVTFSMWRTFRNNANQQPPKPPKREFCGDV